MANKNKNIQDRLKALNSKFDEFEMPLNHRDLFEKKLDERFGNELESEDDLDDSQSRGTKNEPFVFSLSLMQKYAAVFVVAVGLLSSIYLLDFDINNTSNVSTDKLAEGINVEKAEELYSVEVKDALQPLRTKGQKLSPEYLAFLKQLDKLDRVNEKIKTELESNPESEELMQELIDNYKQRLDILQKIKTMMENGKINLK